MRIIKFIYTIAFVFLCVSLTGCGFIERKHKKEVAEELYSRYPTVPGDVPYDFTIYRPYIHGKPSPKDTLLLVKNNGKYYQINKYGNRRQFKYVKVRR